MEEQPDCANSSVDKVNSQPHKLVNSAKSSFWRKKIKSHVTALRRSNRIQNTTITAQNQTIEPVVQEIIFSESDKEDEQDASMEEDLPNSTPGEKSMGEKMDYISKLLEAQGKNIENLMSKVLVEVKSMWWMYVLTNCIFDIIDLSFFNIYCEGFVALLYTKFLLN